MDKLKNYCAGAKQQSTQLSITQPLTANPIFVRVFVNKDIATFYIEFSAH